METKTLRGVLLFVICIVAPLARAATVTVQVGQGGLRFTPDPVTIQPGDSVQWVWAGNSHSTTSGTSGKPSGLFDSGVHDSGFQFSHTFAASGAFPYFCSVHSSCCGMTGTVMVAAATPTPSPTPSPTPLLPRIGQGPVSVELAPVATGLTAPIDLMPAGDGTDRLFIVQQTGEVRLLKGGQLLTTPFLDVSSRLVTINAGYDERGLLGLAFHPGFANPVSPGFHKLYTYTNEPVSGAADFTVPISGSFNNQAVLAEWQVSSSNPDAADITSRREVLRINHPQSNHNGGKVAFRASDHYLYIAEGDGGAAKDVGSGHNTAIGNGQDLTTVLGKILRIDPIDPALTPTSADPVSANGKYRVPASNPFVGKAGLAEIYAYGLRNPYRFGFDAVADQLVAGDVGQDNVEEVDIVESGNNYGWHRKEGTFLFNAADGSVLPDPSPDPALSNPVAEYSHDDGSAVIGGFVYRGTSVPALAGKYVFGDLSIGAEEAPGGKATGRLFYTDLANGIIRELRIGAADRALNLFLKGWGQDASGELYALTDANVGPSGTGGQVLKLTAIPAAPALVNISTRLEVETGDNVLIGGFIVTGSAPKRVIMRAIGPSLNVNGQPVSGRLANPMIELHDSTGTILASNDDWMNGTQKQEISDSGFAPANALESALIATLPPGRYTAIVRDTTGASGIGLVEVFDLDQNAPANPANISTRGLVGTGDNLMIGGFIIGGTPPHRVILRAIGPSLAAQGVSGALLDPTLELRDANGTLLNTNDNWRDTQEAEIAATTLAPPDDHESAIVTSLPNGNYTALVRGVGDASGVGLVEIFNLP